jgi:hypothetical protein
VNLVVVLLLMLAAGPATAGEAVDAVETGGSGELTMCRSWLVFSDCNSYHHIAIPERIETGSKIKLVYGSNNKVYYFPVMRIAAGGGSCTIYGEPGTATDKVDKIAVMPCHAAAK